MGVAKRTRKFAQVGNYFSLHGRILIDKTAQRSSRVSHVVKRVISRRDSRRKENAGKADAANAQKAKVTANNDIIREVPQMPSSLFFQFNENLKPPYSVLVDTNFLSHTVQRKLPLVESMMELEKLGPKYRIIVQALRIARDERWERLECDHKGTYADDCIVDRVMKHRIYIVATNDKDLCRRVRKIPGVPIMNVARGKYVIERLPGAPH
ncbi:hypothetical protein DL765_000525 [Monosporascus sp. GIB2]|nr:hypothetical protein DL765_000525 [Monosporascus sp. GIB2]